MMSTDNSRPTFTSLYFDTNVLLANRWPDPAPSLHNVFTFARWWDINCCLPEPVVNEAEFHWLRKLQDAANAFGNARSNFMKAVTPLSSDATIAHASVAELHEHFRATVATTIRDFAITRIGYTTTSVQQLFSFAARYVRPFAVKGEGKGFKDVVILLSIIEHLQQNPGTYGVFITNDGDFKDVDYSALAPSFDQRRLRLSDLETVCGDLFRSHFNETRVKPYRRLIIALKELVDARIDDLQGFIASATTAEMMRSGVAETVQQVITIDRVHVRGVDFPFPEEPTPQNGTIDMTIKVLVSCRAVVAVNLTMLRSMFGRSDAAQESLHIDEKLLSWFASVDASATLVAGEPNRVDFVRLIGE